MTWEDVKDEPTDSLIDFIKYKEHADYIELAEASFVAFTFRFRKEIISKCRNTGRKWDYDNATCDLIAERVFDRFWKYPFGFEKNKCGNLSIENCVIVYLLRVARNCFNDHAKELSGESHSVYDGTEDIVVELPSIEGLKVSDKRKADLLDAQEKIEKALAQLSPKHKIIYLTYKAHEKDGYKLPRTLLKKLREELDIGQNTIRVYKKEATNLIDQYLKSHDTE